MKTAKISVLIITKNEEANLKELLPTLDFTDNIVVVDSFSDDNTIKIAEKYTDQVFVRKFDNHASQKNWGLEKVKYEWVLILDADERVNDKLIKEVFHLVENSQGNVAFWIKRKNHFMNKRINYCGWQRDKVIRLINKNYCKYNSLIIHEEIEAQGNVGFMSEVLDHNTYKGLSDYLIKINDYTNKKAQLRFNQGKKVSYFGILFKPGIKFLNRYILKLGFLDGVEGLIVCLLTAFNVFLTDIKLLRLYKGEKLY